MTRKLDEALCNKYPKIFVNRHGNMKTTAMCWGFSCGDGWYWLIDKLCSQLQWNTDHNNQNGKYPQIVATQVKEKFGGLRFYVEGASDVQHAIISWAESLSYDICESCGTTKDVSQTEGWVFTECPNCRLEREKNTSRKRNMWQLLISRNISISTKKYALKKLLKLVK